VLISREATQNRRQRAVPRKEEYRRPRARSQTIVVVVVVLLRERKDENDLRETSKN